MYEIRKVRKNRGRYPGDRWIVFEVGTPNAAVHKKELEAQVTLRYLNEGKAKFCECGNYVIGIQGRNESHMCVDGKRKVD